MLVVILSPVFDFFRASLRLVNQFAFSHSSRQPPVEALCVRVLRRLARLNQLQPHPALLAPGGVQGVPVFHYNGWSTPRCDPCARVTLLRSGAGF